MPDKRVGRFTVTYDILKNPMDYVRLFDGMVVVKIEDLYMQGLLEYTAYGSMFEPLSEGRLVPEYVATAIRSNTKLPATAFSWSRVGERKHETV